MINWGRIDYKVRSVNKNQCDGKSGGVVPYDALSMFKAILLSNWHSLSDKELEDALNVRIDFMLFCDFDLMNNTPDETTICRFRNRLIEKNLLNKLLVEINSQLEGLGLKVKKANMAIVDATIIESASRPTMKILEEVAQDRSEVDANQYQTKKEAIQSGSKYQGSISSDPDAKWLKKGTKFYFGYKSFATTDEDGFVINTHTTPANEAEVNKLEIMINNINAHRMSGDKAYDSKANREFLKKKNIKSGIMALSQI
jgi:IS5 family transposase